MSKMKASYEETSDKTVKMANEIYGVCSSLSNIYSDSIENNEYEIADKCSKMYDTAANLLKDTAEILRYVGNKAWLEKQNEK